jgi:hypothetical protein
MKASDQPHVLVALPSEKNVPFPLSAKLGGPQGWSGRFGEEKKVLPVQRFETLIVQHLAFSSFKSAYSITTT